MWHAETDESERDRIALPAMPNIFQIMQGIGAMAMLVGGVVVLWERKRAIRRVHTDVLTPKRMRALIGSHRLPWGTAFGFLVAGIGLCVSFVFDRLSYSMAAKVFDSVGFLSALVGLACLYLSTKRIKRLVEEYHGWLCPRCLYPIAGVSKGTMRCPECGDRFDVETAVLCWWGDPLPEETDPQAEHERQTPG